MVWPIAIDLHGLDAETDGEGVTRVAGVRLTEPLGRVTLRDAPSGVRLVASVRLAGEPRARWLQLDAMELNGSRFDTVVAFVSAGHGEWVTVVAESLRREVESRLPRSGVHPRQPIDVDVPAKRSG